MPRGGTIVEIHFHGGATRVLVPVGIGHGTGRDLIRRLAEVGLAATYHPRRSLIVVDGEQNIA